MATKLQLHARDVTLLSDTRPAPPPQSAPERVFFITHATSGYTLEFDAASASVPYGAMQDLLVKVAQLTSLDWRCSRDLEIQTAFRPLSRILQRINSTPTYHLFLAGFHIGDTIGLFQLGQLSEKAIADSFRYLVGTLRWTHGKKGRLFFLPDGLVATQEVEIELMANGKLISADLFTGEAEPTSHVEHKLYVPYATPIGFNTQVQPETEKTWQRIADLVRQQRGGSVA